MGLGGHARNGVGRGDRAGVGGLRDRAGGGRGVLQGCGDRSKMGSWVTAI